MNILKAESIRKEFTNYHLLIITLNKYRNIHRTAEHIKFTESCITNHLFPQFCQVTTSEAKRLGLNKKEIITIQNRKLAREKIKQTENLKKHEF